MSRDHGPPRTGPGEKEVLRGFLDHLGRPVPGRPAGPSMRWVLTHMIEETGRHAGHADILREQIDGATGR